jgi:hypothetical protein
VLGLGLCGGSCRSRHGVGEQDQLRIWILAGRVTGQW